VSLTTIIGTAPCPNVANIPICFLVAVGYVAMLVAQFVSPGKLKGRLFYPAWALVFLIAVLGTGSELAIGNACPKSDGGMPLCYFSLALCVAIILAQRFISRLDRSSAL
jgi:hypothetical protein